MSPQPVQPRPGDDTVNADLDRFEASVNPLLLGLAWMLAQKAIRQAKA